MAELYWGRGLKSLGTHVVLNLVFDELIPASLPLLHQREDWLVALHGPGALLCYDAVLKFQVSPVGPVIHTATEEKQHSVSLLPSICELVDRRSDGNPTWVPKLFSPRPRYNAAIESRPHLTSFGGGIVSPLSS